MNAYRTYIKKSIFAEYQINTVFQIFILAIIGLVAMLIGIPYIAAQGFLVLLYTSPLWIMFLIPKSFWFYWLHYIQHKNIDGPSNKPMLVEVKLSKEMLKSPRAMELVFEALHIRPSMTTEFQKKWRGNVAPWWSFEIVSDAGKIHFYIWMLKRTRARVESAIYAHYPDVQLVEVEDYTKHAPFDPETMSVIGSNFTYYTSDVHPIKTYYDFGLDKDPKTEFKVDPLVSMLEIFGSIKTGHIWVQIIIQQAVDSAGWRKRVADAIQLMYDETSPEWADPSNPENVTKGSAILRPMQYEYIKAMQRATTKSAFDVGIRFIHFDDKKYFSGMVGHQIMNMYKFVGQQKGPYYNWIAPDGDSYLSDFDWPWEDFRGMFSSYKTKKLFTAYKARSYFAPPIIDDAFIMTSEQLATIYHFPGEEAQALGIERIESKRGGPPPDLPV
jgi:hypothetical protein